MVSALLFAAGTTAASGPTMRVDFDAPAGCSDADAFRRGVLARLDRAADADLIATTRIEVRITRAGNRVEGELRLLHPPGVTDTRKVQGRTCDEVAGVLALTAALALQRPSGAPSRPAPSGAPPRPAPSRPAPRATTPPTPPAREAPGPGPAPAPPNGTREPTATTPEARPAPAADAPRAPTATPPVAPPPPKTVDTSLSTGELPAAPAAPTTAFEIGAAAAVGRLLTPGLNLGGVVTLGVTHARSGGLPRSLRVSVLYLPKDLLRPDGEVASTWIGGALTGCPGWGVGQVGLAAELCARAIGGWLSVSDRAVSNQTPTGRTWWGAGVLLRGGVALGAGLTLDIEAGVDAVLVERRFITTTPLRTVATTPPASVFVGVGVSRRL